MSLMSAKSMELIQSRIMLTEALEMNRDLGGLWTEAELRNSAPLQRAFFVASEKAEGRTFRQIGKQIGVTGGRAQSILQWLYWRVKWRRRAKEAME